MARDQELVSEEVFKPLRYCTLCKIKVIKEYFLLVLTKADSEMNPAFRIHSLKKDLPFSSLAVFFFLFFFARHNKYFSEGRKTCHAVTHANKRGGMCISFMRMQSNIMDPRRHSG